MLRILVYENGECLLEKRLPDEMRETGCVFLLQETFVATLAVGGSVECGTFNVSLVSDVTPQHDTKADSNQVSPSTDTVTEDAGGRLLADECSDFEVDDTTAICTESNRAESVSLEVYPRIPGYDLQALIGKGGMGLVWKAAQLSTNRMVAVKTIHPRMLNEPKSQKRFKREVELAARLTHPNIVRVYEAGEVAHQNYFSMELVDGVPWSQHVHSNQLTKSEVLQQLLQVLDAVAYAHTQGVIHRDLKPSNILIDKSGKVYVVDFGLAKYNAADSEELSQQGDIIGTLTFMSPEQASGDVSSTDSRSDVYSLGAVVVYLLGNGLKLNKVRRNDSSSRTSNDGVLQKQAAAILRNDPRLRRILVKALAPQPDQRYENAGAFASDLRDYLEVRLTEVMQSNAQRPLKKSRWLLAGITVLALLGFGTIGGVYWYYNVRPTETAASDPMVDAEGKTNNDNPNVSDKELQRDREIAAKFGDRFEASFQSTGDAPENVTLTSGVGHQDPADYPVVHPKRWPLAGFNLATYRFQDRLIIKTIQPIFRDPTTGKTETSELFGRLHPKCEYHQVLAKPGYQLVGIDGVGGKRLYALRATFASASNGSGAEEESYDSPWIGDPLNDSIETVGDTGEPAIGMLCSHSADIHQVGLILEKAETEDN